MRGFIGVILAGVVLATACGEAGESMQEVPDTQPADEQPGEPPDNSEETRGEPATSPPASDSSPPATDAAPPAEETSPPADAAPPESPATPTARAVADLADRLGLAADAISVVLMEDVTWSDGSLGCPEPGMSYTQALVDGYRIVLEANGTEFHYHAAGGDDPFYCANPSRPAAGALGDA